MSLFVRRKDVDLFDTINTELINTIVNTEVNIFKLSMDETEENLYGESMRKIYYAGVAANCLITPEAQTAESDEFGPNYAQAVTFAFHRMVLVDLSLVIETGDIIEWNNAAFEVDTIVENTLIGVK